MIIPVGHNAGAMSAGIRDDKSVTHDISRTYPISVSGRGRYDFFI